MLLENNSLNGTKRSRINYIDIFRSFGIILMIMGHVGFGESFDHFIHAFHMPMFFWISGYLYIRRPKEEVSFSAFLLKKARSLLLPYTVFGLAHYILFVIINALAHKSFDISPLLHLFSVNTDGLPICGALWFLTALFFTDTMFFLLDRYISNQSVKTIIIIVVTLIGNHARTIFPFTLPFALGSSLVGVGAYYIGHLFRKYHDSKIVSRLMDLSWTPTILLSGITVILIFLNGYINMRSQRYSIVALFWINVFLSVIVGVNLSKLIYRYVQNSFWEKWLTRIGRDSIIYVCLNQVVVTLMRELIRMVMPVKYLSSILVFITTMVMLYFISLLFANSKLKLIIGRK